MNVRNKRCVKQNAAISKIGFQQHNGTNGAVMFFVLTSMYLIIVFQHNVGINVNAKCNYTLHMFYVSFVILLQLGT